jgi:hypothetical protein
MNRHAALVVAALLWLATAPAAADEVLPFGDLEVGMTGVGRTVFHGQRVEEFKVEIVGLLENIFPQRNLILVRCSGPRIAETGVAQGMSGSPIYIKGRLVGALAYTWGFAKEPIAGVTPIEEMEKATAEGRPPRDTAEPASLTLLFEPQHMLGFFPSLLARSRVHASPGAALRWLGIPLHAVGFEPDVMADLAPALGGTLLPMSGALGSGDATPAEPGERPVPGSAVGVQLVNGDLNLTAIGTVTRVEGDELLAFGHPFLNIGTTAMTMTAAEVHLVMPSLQSSFKLASPAGAIGTVHQDRASGLRGTLGDAAPGVPVTLEMGGPGRPPQSFAFELVDDPLLTPILLNYVVRNVISSAEKDVGPMTVTLQPGSVILMDDHEPVLLENLFSGAIAAPFAAGLPAYVLYLLMNNEFEPAGVEAVNLRLDFEGRRRSARIGDVWADRERVRAGETVRLHLTIRPFRAEPVQAELDLELPPETPPGTLVVRVGDGLTLSRLETRDEPVIFAPENLPQLIRLLNHIRSFNRVYANVSTVDEGILVGGTRLPNLPPSVAQVLLMPQAGGNFVRIRQRGLLEEFLDTEYAVTGYRKIFLEVIP